MTSQRQYTVLTSPSTNIGIDTAISTISMAIQEAVDNCPSTKGRESRAVKFTAAWVGMAGYDRPSLSSTIDSAISKLLDLPLGPGSRLKITTDIDLLPTTLTADKELRNAIVVVAGTGSIAMSYAKADGQFQRTNRVGGWGYLLGDDGSGYGIGRQALRTALASSDILRISRKSNPGTTAAKTLSKLSEAVFQHFKGLYPASKPEDLLSTILVPDPAQHQAGDAASATTKRIAGVAKLVLSLAKTDAESRRIVEDGAGSLVDLVALLVDAQGIDPAVSGLVLAGGMIQDGLYKDVLLEKIGARCGTFKQIECVSQPAIAGAQHLLQLHVKG
jgi:N-acetylmuramic acid 6-phosphate etherase